MDRACVVCGAPFTARHRRHRHCPEHEQHGREFASPTTRAQDSEYERNRRLVLQRDADKPCPLCGQPILPGEPVDVDHVRPVARGGTNAMTNMQRAHATCNRTKRAHTTDTTAPSAAPVPPADRHAPAQRALRLA